MLRRALILSLCIATLAVTCELAVARNLAAGPIHRQKVTPMSVSLPIQLPAPTIKIVDSRPARLLIPRIGVNATVESRGLDSKRNMETPNDFRDVAWYNRGPAPGLPGNALINGHVNWWTGDAVFTHLGQLRAGDLVMVVRADGSEVSFKVTSTQTVAANARIASLFAPSPVATLTLITCTGVWNPLTQTDAQRLLVSAVLA